MSYDNTSNALEFLTESFASVIVDVDSKAEHSRWKPGIGPFEEERQIEMLVEAIGNYSGELSLKRERTYPSSQRRCDLIIETGIDQVPVEAKLLRFRYDNGSILPAMREPLRRFLRRVRHLSLLTLRGFVTPISSEMEVFLDFITRKRTKNTIK
jgi:hypothetical protein